MVHGRHVEISSRVKHMEGSTGSVPTARTTDQD
jgi:hypothetical protein